MSQSNFSIDPAFQIKKPTIEAIARIVFCHGAGAGFQSYFLSKTSDLLVDRGFEVVEVTFSYMIIVEQTQKKRPPSKMEKLEQELLSVLARAKTDLPLILAGKSMGARVAVRTSYVHKRPVIGFGFPLIPQNNQAKSRAAELEACESPCLILQGQRDKFGSDLTLSEIKFNGQVVPVLSGDHDFVPLKKSHTSQEENLKKAAEAAYQFILRVIRN